MTAAPKRIRQWWGLVVLEINQDPLGVQGRRAKAGGGEAVIKPLEDGSKAVGLFNPGSEPAKVSIDWSALGLKGKRQVRDLWRQKNLGIYSDRFTAEVRPHGVVLVRLTPVAVPENGSSDQREREAEMKNQTAWLCCACWTLGMSVVLYADTAVPPLDILLAVMVAMDIASRGPGGHSIRSSFLPETVAVLFDRCRTSVCRLSLLC